MFIPLIFNVIDLRQLFVEKVFLLGYRKMAEKFRAKNSWHTADHFLIFHSYANRLPVFDLGDLITSVLKSHFLP